MKYIIKCLIWSVTAGCMTACTDRFDTKEYEQGTDSMNGSRTELVEKTVTLTETDSLGSLINGEERTELQKLIVKGNITDADIFFLQNEMPLLTVLDLKEATFTDNTIPYRFISENNMLEKVELPLNLEIINNYGFYKCTALKEVVMNEGLTTIKPYAFSECKKLKKAVFPNSLTNIDYYSFYKTDLDSLVLGENIEYIGHNAFEETGLKYVDLKCNNAELSSNIFNSCTSLEKVILYEGLTSIPSSFLNNCTNLKEINIPNSVTEISSYAFSNTDITEVTIHSGIKAIGYNCFYNCDKLKKVIFNANPEDWEYGTFQECQELEEVILNNDIKTIPANTFDFCKKLTNIVLPDSITTLGAYSLKETNISDIDLKNVKEIKDYALSSSKIRNITIPQSVTSAGNYILDSCDSLEYVVWKTSADLPVLTDRYYSKTLIFVDTNNDSIPNINNAIKNNIIIDNHIDSMFIDLSDISNNIVFKMPRKVTYRKIVFRKNFTTSRFNITELGKASGWETITLPIVPTKIVTTDDGRVLAPFNTEMETEYCPFWLRKLTENGFEDTTNFEAYKPFIINMPYNTDIYYPEYNINSYVDFIAENGEMEPSPEQMTPDEGLGLRFWPNYTKQEPDGYKYVLNTTTYNGYYPGHFFVRSMYSVYPFEAYITKIRDNDGTALELSKVFNSNKPASRTAKTRNNTGRPQIDDL